MKYSLVWADCFRFELLYRQDRVDTLLSSAGTPGRKVLKITFERRPGRVHGKRPRAFCLFALLHRNAPHTGATRQLARVGVRGFGSCAAEASRDAPQLFLPHAQKRSFGYLIRVVFLFLKGTSYAMFRQTPTSNKQSKRKRKRANR